MKIKRSQNFPRSFKSVQQGMAMLVVIVALLVLTILGLSASDSTSLQALMVRNSQLRLETFNASLAEIESQLDYVGPLSPGQALLVKLVNTGGELVNDGDGTQEIAFQSPNDLLEKRIALRKEQDCFVYGNTIGANGVIKCNLMGMDSLSEIENSSIGSDQQQQFEFLSY